MCAEEKSSRNGLGEARREGSGAKNDVRATEGLGTLGWIGKSPEAPEERPLEVGQARRAAIEGRE
jgi:hypothetical protein